MESVLRRKTQSGRVKGSAGGVEWSARGPVSRDLQDRGGGAKDVYAEGITGVKALGWQR